MDFERWEIIKAMRQLIRKGQIRVTKIEQWRILSGDFAEFVRARTNR
jgi:hypothetical protein